MVFSVRSSGRTLAAALFTDIVGSTATRSEYGDDAAERLRRAHDQLVQDAVKAHDGTVVKGLGDGAMAIFAGASEAVEAAIAIQRGANRVSTQEIVPVPLELRIGVSVGEVIWENDDCFGSAVIEASRLCGCATGGHILASDLVRVLTGGRLGSLFTSNGALSVKGLTKPLETVEVAWRVHSGEAVIPLPATLERMGRIPFSGRMPERAALLRQWKQATSGARTELARAALVAGEPGVGKTRLVREIALDVHRHGAIVLFGQCDENLSMAYHPFVDALQDFVAACDDGQLRSMLGPLGGELAALLPTLPERVPGLASPMRAEQETERYRLFEAVVDFFAAMSSTAPVLLILDDLHWADSLTMLLLRHLLRSTEPMRLLIAGTYRDTDTGLDHPLTQLLPDLRRAGRGARVSLSGLDRDGVAEMVAGAVGRDLDGDEVDFARHLHAETDGHPFCVEEVLLHLAETSTPEQGHWTPASTGTSLDIPEGVREIVAQRLARLPGNVPGVLATAAVIGQQFDVLLLSALVDGGMQAVVEALDTAERARLAGPVPGNANRYQFAHALIRSSIYEAMPTSRRRWLHRDVGLALEGLAGNGDRLNELAIHFGEAAAVGETARAIAYARQAAEHACAIQAYDQAVAHYARTLAALKASNPRDPELECDLLLAQAEAQYRIGDDFRAVAFTAADNARVLGDADRLANAALLLVRFGPANPVVNVREVALLEEALAGLEDEGESQARARLLAGLGAALSLLRSERAVPYSREAVEMARRLGDPMVLAQVLVSHHAAIAGPDTSEERLLVARELVALGEQLNDAETTFAGHLSCYVSLVEAGDIDGADAALDAGDRIARELRQPAFAFHVLRAKTAQALLAGRTAEGEHLATAMTRKGREANISDPTLDAMVAGFLVLAREQQGRLPELEPEISRLAGLRPDWLLLQAAQGQLQCLTGQPAHATKLLNRLFADGFTTIQRDDHWFETIMHLAAITAHLGNTRAAAALYELLHPYAGHNTYTGMGSFGPVDRTLGLLAVALERYETAEQHFTAAIELSTALRAPGWAAHARTGLAHMLSIRGQDGDHDRGKEIAAQALADADELGLTGLAGQLRALLADEGLPDEGLPDEELPDEELPDEELPDEGLPDEGLAD
jgi:class 3 adenylate cyclase/tetratricopeptide (TPR) repeat protein